MTYIARLSMSKSTVVRLIDSMPKERGSGFLAGVFVGRAVNRTYTRVDGDEFQISRTAGMGPSVVCSGKISEQYGQSVIILDTTYGVIPIQVWPALALAALIGAVMFIGLLGASYAETAWTMLGVSCLLGGLWWFKLWDAKFLRGELSKYLEGARWLRSQ